MSRIPRPLLLVPIGLLVAGVAVVLIWRRPEGPPTAGWRTEAVDRGPITTTVTATGTVNPVTTVQVGTYVSGPILALDVDFNSPVTRGQRVAKIDPAPFEVKVRRTQAALATARSRVEKDQADLTLKQRTLARQRELHSRQLVAESDVDAAVSEFEQARAQLALDSALVQQAEAELEEARVNLDFTDIRSPVDGVVVSRNVDVGQTVAASFQTPTLFLIAQDLTKMQVNTAVSESDIGGVAVGQKADFVVDAFRQRRFTGDVIQVRNAPTVVQNVVTYDVILAVENPNLELRPGMTATVTIVTAERGDVVRLPARALRFRPALGDATGATPSPRTSEDRGPTAPRAWRERNGKLEEIELALGLRNETWAEVRSGLEPGDRVAVGLLEAERTRPPAPMIPGAPRFR